VGLFFFNLASQNGKLDGLLFHLAYILGSCQITKFS